MEPVPIHIVRADGQIELLGEWRPASKVLALEKEGYPFLGPGEHLNEGDLPWVFWEMCPSGHLGAAFARRHPELSLPSDPRTWSAPDCLSAISTHGFDLPGNLIVGQASLDEWMKRRDAPRTQEQHLDEAIADHFHTLRDAGGSSVGGDRPKLAFGRKLVKYSPPIDTPLGARWRDLLRTESHCADTLSAHGIQGVQTTRSIWLQPPVPGDREFLFIERYDRTATDNGRVGATTFYFYTLDFFGDASEPAPEVARRAVAAGHLPAQAAETCARIHAFSLAIGNTDAHLGNYGLIFDEHGRASLAPAFDVLPMALAPRFDELPDAYLTPAGVPIAPVVRPLVEDLANRIGGDANISAEFKALWRSHVGL